MEEPITRRAEAQTLCWDVPSDTGLHAVSCRGPCQYLCHAIFVAGLLLGGTARPHGNIALQTLSKSRPVQSPEEAPTWGGDPRPVARQSDASNRDHRKPSTRA